MDNLKDSILNCNKLHDLANIISCSTAHVSFLGHKYITSKNFHSIASVSLIAFHALKLLKPFAKSWQYSKKDRKEIEQIITKIDSFYIETDELLKEKGLLAKIFNVIFIFFEMSFTVRRNWVNMPDLVNYYSQTQYKEIFGSKPKHISEKTVNGIPLYRHYFQ